MAPNTGGHRITVGRRLDPVGARLGLACTLHACAPGAVCWAGCRVCWPCCGWWCLWLPLPVPGPMPLRVWRDARAFSFSRANVNRQQALLGCPGSPGHAASLKAYRCDAESRRSGGCGVMCVLGVLFGQERKKKEIGHHVIPARASASALGDGSIGPHTPPGVTDKVHGHG